MGSDEVKRTNEIGMAIPLLANCALAGKDVTADALLTQRSIATYIVEQKGHYHFTVKGNQPTLEEDIALIFAQRGAADFVEITPPDHGRIETRRIWCTTALNDYLDFPHVGQVFMIEREAFNKKSGKSSHEIALGSPVGRRMKRRPSDCWPSIAATGASRVFITSSTGTTMRIAPVSVPVMAQKTSLSYAASLSAC